MVEDRKTVAEISSLLNVFHSLHEAVAEMEFSFSDSLLHPKCTKVQYYKYFHSSNCKDL